MTLINKKLPIGIYEGCIVIDEYCNSARITGCGVEVCGDNNKIKKSEAMRIVQFPSDYSRGFFEEIEKISLKEYNKILKERISTVRQYFPAFYSGFEEKESKFNSIEDLLKIDWIKKWSETPNFYRYSISRLDYREQFIYALMAEYEGGCHWFVIGYIDKYDLIKELPNWAPNYKKSRKKQ